MVPRVGKEVGRGLGVVEIRVGEHGREALLLSVGSRELADAVAVQMFRNVLAIVLRVNLPKGLQVLSRDHLQTAVAAGVPGEVRDVENAAHERDDDATLHTRQERSGALDQGAVAGCGFRCGGGKNDAAHLLADQLVYLVERHDAVHASHSTRHLAVAAAGPGEEVEALYTSVIFAVVTSLAAARGGRRGDKIVAVAGVHGCLGIWLGET